MIKNNYYRYKITKYSKVTLLICLLLLLLCCLCAFTAEEAYAQEGQGKLVNKGVSYANASTISLPYSGTVYCYNNLYSNGGVSKLSDTSSNYTPYIYGLEPGHLYKLTLTVTKNNTARIYPLVFLSSFGLRVSSNTPYINYNDYNGDALGVALQLDFNTEYTFYFSPYSSSLNTNYAQIVFSSICRDTSNNSTLTYNFSIEEVSLGGNTDEAYQEGFQAGVDSVDTQQFYDNGYQAGVDSVDTQQYYDNGYSAGYTEGEQSTEAYQNGVIAGEATGYDKGLVEASKMYGSGLFNGARYYVQGLTDNGNITFEKQGNLGEFVANGNFNLKQLLQSITDIDYVTTTTQYDVKILFDSVYSYPGFMDLYLLTDTTPSSNFNVYLSGSNSAVPGVGVIYDTNLIDIPKADYLSKYNGIVPIDGKDNALSLGTAIYGITFERVSKNDNFSIGINSSYDLGYKTGKNEGYSQGLADGFGQGQATMEETSYNAGYSTGYNKGVIDGAEQYQDYSFLGLMESVVFAPVQVFTSLLDFEILGVNISSFMLSILSVALVLAGIKWLL